MKKTSFIFLVCVFLFGGQSAVFSQENKPLTIYTIKGPSGISMIRLFEEPPAVPGYKVSVEAVAQADIMASKIIAGEVLIGVLPVNVAAKIASTGKKIQAAAVLGNGMLSLLTSDPSIQRIEDLKGKEIACAGQGATPEFVFRRILQAKGLDAEKDLKLSFSLAYPEIAQSLIAGRITTALLPEPFASMARAGKSDLRNVSDIQKEWAAIAGKKAPQYPMTALVVNADFAAANKEAMRIILKAIRDSSDWVVAEPQKAAQLVEKHNFGLRAPVVERAIPASNYVFIPADKAQPSIEALLKVFLELSPASIGGKLPDKAFYYKP